MRTNFENLIFFCHSSDKVQCASKIGAPNSQGRVVDDFRSSTCTEQDLSPKQLTLNPFDRHKNAFSGRINNVLFMKCNISYSLPTTDLQDEVAGVLCVGGFPL